VAAWLHVFPNNFWRCRTIRRRLKNREPRPEVQLPIGALALPLRRPSGTRSRRTQRGTYWLDVAAWGRPSERVATESPHATNSLPRTQLCEGTRILLRVNQFTASVGIVICESAVPTNVRTGMAPA